MPLLFLLILAASAFAKDWVHYYGQKEVRDVAKTENGTIWAALAWGLQERSAKGQIMSYTPGNDGLEAADFVQVFALPNGDIIAASRDGTLVRKNKNSRRFETVNSSFTEKKRSLETGLGKIAGNNILVLPFNGALAFFDYSANRSVITLLQIGSSSLEEYKIKRVAIRGDSIWVDLDDSVWKRKIDWKEIHADNYLADPKSWIEAKDKKIPFAEEAKPEYKVVTNIYLERVKMVSLYGNEIVAWGISDDWDCFVRTRGDDWSLCFSAGTSEYYDDIGYDNAKSLALLPSGYFALGRQGAGLLTFDNNFPYAKRVGWFHSKNTDNKCPTEWSNSADLGWTLVRGVAAAPDFSGYIFSYVSEGHYGLGFADSDSENAICAKAEEASSPIAYSVIARENEAAKWEIYVAWRNTLSFLEFAVGGVDFYEVADPKSFKPIFNKKWALSFGSPIDFAFDKKGVLWAVSQSKIFYLDKDSSEWKEPSSIIGFNGGTISALETDARNGLWVATLGNGAYLLSQVNNSPDSLKAKHFRVKDGLLSDIVYDIAIDTIKGRVYFGNDFGLSVYNTALVRDSEDYMQDGAKKIIVYPNPFRPNLHSKVIIDYISESSSVHILDSSGKRVKFFKGDDLRGGRVTWDGKNENGKLVAPGLYHYVAKDGKKVAKGKIILER